MRRILEVAARAALVSCLAASIFAQPPQPAPQQTQPQAGAPQTTPVVPIGNLQIPNGSLREVVDQLARALKINIIMDPKLAGTVSIQTYGEVRNLDARNLLELILRINGFGMVQEGEIFRIVAMKDVLKQPIPFQRKAGADIPEDDQLMLNLIFLKYVTVDELSKIIEPFTGDNAVTLAYPPANLLFVLDSRRNMRRLMELISLFDSDMFANDRVKLFELKNSRPSDMQKDLENVLKSISLDSKNSTVKFLAVDRISTLIAVAPNPGVFDTVADWIKKLDVPITAPTGSVDNYVYKVRYGRADCLAMALSSLFGMPGGGSITGGYGGGYGGYGGGYGGYGGVNPGSAYANPYAGGGGYAGAYGAVNGYNGFGGGGGYGAGFGGLGYGGGYGAANNFNSSFGGAGACMGGSFGGGGYGGGSFGYPAFGGYSAQAPLIGANGAPGASAAAGAPGSAAAAGSAAQQLGPGGTLPPVPPRIVANPLNNSLLIQADPQQYQSILKVLKELDVPPRQILLEAKIYEVDLADQFATGIQWNYQPRSGASLNGVGQLTSAGAGIISIGALVQNGRELMATLALNENASHVHMVSEPSLIATDSIPAVINVGTQVPVSTGSTNIPSSNGVVTTNQISAEDTGVTLQVNARVNPSGVVTLMVNQQISGVSSNVSSTVGGTPAFDQQIVQTQITLLDGDTIAIGGTIKDSVSNFTNGLPGLSRIPVLGSLFGSKTRSHTRSELIIFMTPHVIYDETNLIEASDELVGRVRKLRKYINRN